MVRWGWAAVGGYCTSIFSLSSILGVSFHSDLVLTHCDIFTENSGAAFKAVIERIFSKKYVLRLVPVDFINFLRGCFTAAEAIAMSMKQHYITSMVI